MASQPLNASLPIPGTFSAYTYILVNPLQPSNAFQPIVVILAGRFKLVNPLQPRNAPSLIEVIPAGRFKLVNPLQFQKVLLVDYQYYTL